MNDDYIRRPTPVKAWRYARQPQAEWPQWLLDYEVSTPIGLQRIGAGPGVLLVPTKSGITLNVVDGDYVVLENNRLSIERAGEFEAHFQPVEEAATSE